MSTNPQTDADRIHFAISESKRLLAESDRLIRPIGVEESGGPYPAASEESMGQAA